VNRAEERAERAERRAEQAEQRGEEANKRADAALALADRSLAQLADATAEANTLREAIDGLRAKVARTEDMADQASAQAQEAAGRIAEMERAEVARKARGRWARLRAAWRGN
jgi:phage shock protein A